jgi:hypothetical protein
MKLCHKFTDNVKKCAECLWYAELYLYINCIDLYFLAKQVKTLFHIVKYIWHMLNLDHRDGLACLNILATATKSILITCLSKSSYFSVRATYAPVLKAVFKAYLL